MKEHTRSRWKSDLYDNADTDETVTHPSIRKVTIRKVVTTHPVSGRGIEWRNGVDHETAWEVTAEDIAPLIAELASALAYYAAGDRDHDRGLELRRDDR